ncbi:uncharacterized protein LOC132042532 [Lycium ferocissimum]|uniref:uncharacterized protein LOC132042532 n=1 Tax=Lycium ferocissimum TaxID=112874 RepID=UPI002816679D|nr:uncharacterized protein LOC132042532 [Lycium ferocissimum]
MITNFFKSQTTSDSPPLSSRPCPVIHNVDDVNPSRPSGKDNMLDLGPLESDPAKRTSNYSPHLRDREDVKQFVSENVPQNDIMIWPSIQKDIVSSCAKETMKAIVEDFNRDYFGILVDESKDVSYKEQMALILRYINKEENNLSSSQIRGKGYDGASNMQGEINGLKTLILKDSPSAYCIHCFAHQLQLTLVAVAKKHHEVDQFFDILAKVLNVFGGSFKRKEMLRDDQAEKFKKLPVLSEVHIGSGLDQELRLQRAGIHVGVLILRQRLLAITHDLNMALQRKDQDIISAMNLVGFTKRQLQSMREFKWDSLVKEVSSFCVKHDIVIPEMDYVFGKSKRKSSSVKYSHHLCVEVFNVAIDLQLAELNNHFDEVNTDLLLGMASLSPDNSFANYDKERIMKLATHYRDEFSVSMLEDLSFELDNYIDYV